MRAPSTDRPDHHSAANRAHAGAGRPVRSGGGRLFSWLGISLGVVIVVLAALTVLLGYLFSGPRHRGPRSDHFDGKRFHNIPDVPHGGFLDFLKWRFTRHAEAWSPRQLTAGPPPPASVTGDGMRATFINHATVLLQMDGVNILTDPIWAERTSPVSFAGPRRVHAPGIRFEDLPHIDAVLVSHCHYDHLDLPTLARLQAVHHPRFFVGLGNAELLQRQHLDRVTELDWWQTDQLTARVRIRGVPAQHFANRGLFDRDATLWLGYVVEGSSGRAYFAGDTGYGPHFAEIRRRVGPVRLAILPIGAFLPTWFMSYVHQSPAEAVNARRVLAAGTALAMHFGTFPLADDGQDEAALSLRAALSGSATDATAFWTLRPGEGRDVPLASSAAALP